MDSGNAIELLPFNIDIIQGLIEFCDEARGGFSGQGKELALRLDQTSPKVTEGTKAVEFVASLSGKTTAKQIADAVALTPDQKARLTDLRRTVLAPQEKLRSKTLLAPMLEAAAPALAAAETVLSEEELQKTAAAHFDAKQKAQSAKDLNAHLLDGCIPSTGRPPWNSVSATSRRWRR
ncbi:hypothetical protein MTBSS4_460018 [Magnetospirillum sp. SS-4]|nr:hypothetical protein MTBSS4_460018 [Magnetospirillum sp. SS-4]